MAAAPLRCRLADLEPTGARGVVLGEGPSARHIVVVVGGGGGDGALVRAYENSCPHLRMPLETVPDRFLDAERHYLVCSMHGARFAVADGYCVSGPCQGAWLRAVPVTVEGGEVRLAAIPTG